MATHVKKKPLRSSKASATTTLVPTTEQPAILNEKISLFRALKLHFGTNGPTVFFLSSAILLAIIDVVVICLTSHVREVSIDYTDCIQSGPVNISCAKLVTSPLNDTCYCELIFYLTKDIPAPVNMYYALTNFYQNHRTYILSKDFNQLKGELSQNVVFECQPYHEAVEGGIKKTIAPCGAIANSMFFDSISLYSVNHTLNVPLLKKNIVWPNIKDKFRNPPGDLQEVFEGYAKPITWKKNIWELDPVDPSNNGFLNEDFIVWMQPATVPNFRKLYRRLDHSRAPFKNGLRAGKYVLKIDYAFPVTAFKGTKSIVLTNSSFFGGRNPFLIYFIMVLSILSAFATFIVLSVRILKIRSAKEAMRSTTIAKKDKRVSPAPQQASDRVNRLDETGKMEEKKETHRYKEKAVKVEDEKMEGKQDVKEEEIMEMEKVTGDNRPITAATRGKGKGTRRGRGSAVVS